jgi:hypothetical protein
MFMHIARDSSGNAYVESIPDTESLSPRWFFTNTRFLCNRVRKVILDARGQLPEQELHCAAIQSRLFGDSGIICDADTMSCDLRHGAPSQYVAEEVDVEADQDVDGGDGCELGAAFDAGTTKFLKMHVHNLMRFQSTTSAIVGGTRCLFEKRQLGCLVMEQAVEFVHPTGSLGSMTFFTPEATTAVVVCTLCKEEAVLDDYLHDLTIRVTQSTSISGVRCSDDDYRPACGWSDDTSVLCSWTYDDLRQLRVLQNESCVSAAVAVFVLTGLDVERRASCSAFTRDHSSLPWTAGPLDVYTKTGVKFPLGSRIVAIGSDDVDVNVRFWRTTLEELIAI